MSNLQPEKRLNVNGHLVTRHIKVPTGPTASQRNLPAPYPSKAAAQQAEAGSERQRDSTFGQKLKKFFGFGNDTDPEQRTNINGQPVEKHVRAATEPQFDLAATEALVHRKNSEGALLIAISENLPGGMRLGPDAQSRINKNISRITDTNIMDAITGHLNSGSSSSLAVMNILESKDDPTEPLRKVGTHLDHVNKELGWDYPISPSQFIVDSLPETGLSTEQEQAILTLEYSLYERPSGAVISPQDYNDSARQIAIERPQDIDRIVELAQQRDPQNVDDYRALLDSDMSGPLGEGVL